MCAVGLISKSWGQVYIESVSLGPKSVLSIRGVGPWTVHFNKFYRYLFQTVMSENSCSRALIPLHLCYCTSNGVQIVQLDVNWGFWPERYKDRLFTLYGANSLRVKPHTLLSKSEMNAGTEPRSSLKMMAMFRIPLTRDEGWPILLGLYTLYQNLCKYLKSFSGHKTVYKNHRPSNDVF